jgi:head-tail adaptor
MSSIRRDMKSITLEKNVPVQGKSGQLKENWFTDRTIDAAIYPVSGSVMYSNNTKFNQSTNTGLTAEKAIQETEKENGNRINDNGTIYKINFVNPAGRYTQLLLQKVI